MSSWLPSPRLFADLLKTTEIRCLYITEKDMIQLNILPLLKQKGKTRYWLYKQLGMSYQNFKRMIENETTSIQIQRIETLCQLLECTPNDLFKIDWEKNEN